jgi:hypothetical protein
MGPEGEIASGTFVRRGYLMLHCSSQVDCAPQHKQSVMGIQAELTFLQCGMV